VRLAEVLQIHVGREAAPSAREHDHPAGPVGSSGVKRSMQDDVGSQDVHVHGAATG